VKNKFKRKRAVWARDRYICHYCGRQLTPDSATVDHVVPKLRGGPFVLWNLVAACHDCNQDKGNRLPQCVCDFCSAAARNPERRAVPKVWEWSA
jgi:5-methylcytosine-specific restriction endonuclease McrA